MRFLGQHRFVLSFLLLLVFCSVMVIRQIDARKSRHIELREQFSLEHVRATLGHSRASMSDHYSKGADGKLAAEVAAKVG